MTTWERSFEFPAKSSKYFPTEDNFFLQRQSPCLNLNCFFNSSTKATSDLISRKFGLNRFVFGYSLFPNYFALNDLGGFIVCSPLPNARLVYSWNHLGFTNFL
jgi:hypothetical protein